ncbi:hypothetical protein L7F22_016925 [Adiantum nelumboides]|nr:hypothetical protein [Adiantum nelumboides]
MRKPLDLENGRPEKLVPCPRCHSLNTKFCYFNNYNLKQPRHFCRECQRYWTAGGSLRNVPIGAGRRKHKIASALLSKLHDSTDATKLNDSLPLQQLVTKGDILQELHSLTGMQSNDVMSVCGSDKAWFSQVFQNPARDVPQKSNMSIVSDGHMSQAKVSTSTPCERHGFQQPGEILQKSSRSAAVEAKIMSGHEAHTSTRLCQYIDIDQTEVSSVEDVCGTEEPDLWSSKISNVCELLPSVTRAMPEPFNNSEVCDSPTSLASSASEAATALNGALSAAPLASHPTGLESIPAFWAPLLWPWIWPFFINGADAPNLAAGIGALAANAAPHAEDVVKANHGSHINTTCFSGLGPGFPQWPYAWNTLPWCSPWSIAWNASNLGHNFSSQEPEKEKQGLLCIPKTLRMDHPDEAAYSSILKTLGVTTLPQSGFLNTFQPKAEVFQPKFIAPKAVEHSELHRLAYSHLNPAAQARSVAFQEGS